ncbi:MAG: hypothetical protein IT530_15545 [Burkholderiales bacterium]|nr:hypothetical protein [Burkholderiales bacterium]
MVRAIAFLAISEGARHGEYRATFHGFCVQAARRCCASAGSGARLQVDLIVSFGTSIVEQSVLGVSDARRMEPNSQDEVISDEWVLLNHGPWGRYREAAPGVLRWLSQPG